MPDPATADSVQEAPTQPDPQQKASHKPPRPEPNPPVPGHGSPAGQPTPDQVAQWQKAEPGRTATKPAAKPAPPTASAATTQEGAATGPGSRDTPPPTGEAAAALAKEPKSDASPSVVRPARPTAAKQQQAKLVDAITHRLAENLAKALRQSVVEAVQELDAPAAAAPTAADGGEPAAAAAAVAPAKREPAAPAAPRAQ